MKRMNAAAFYRGEAITRLEARAPTIVEHLALVTWFPNHAATSHWKAELKAFQTALQRYHKGKGSKHNYTHELIVDALEANIDTHEGEDFLVIEVEAHGVGPITKPDWLGLKNAISEFANSVLASST